MPTVSVVIATYNCAEYLPAAIDSALKQTYTDLEVIIVNDGSIDDTDSVVSPYLQRDNVRYHKKPNGGQARALTGRALRSFAVPVYVCKVPPGEGHRRPRAQGNRLHVHDALAAGA